MIIGLDWMGWDGIGLDWIGWDGIIGYCIWMVFFHPNSDVSRPAGAFLAGAFLFFFLRHILKMVINCQQK